MDALGFTLGEFVVENRFEISAREQREVGNFVVSPVRISCAMIRRVDQERCSILSWDFRDQNRNFEFAFCILANVEALSRRNKADLSL